VTNKTRAFAVVNAVRDGDLVRLSFRNDYSQAINAFTLAGGRSTGVQVDLQANDHEIAPGATYDYRVNAMSLAPSAEAGKPLNVTVLNVVFQDGTGDGDSQATDVINNRRRGEKIALMRIIPLLQAASRANSVTAQGTQKLKQQISEICDGIAKDYSGELQGGIRHGQGFVLHDIEEAEGKQKQGWDDLRQELSKIQDKYERKAARLKD
jgi:hypothetical protein